jgi:hypothetical protein
VNDRFAQALEDLRAVVEDRGAYLTSKNPEVARFAAGVLSEG